LRFVKICKAHRRLTAKSARRRGRQEKEDLSTLFETRSGQSPVQYVSEKFKDLLAWRSLRLGVLAVKGKSLAV
jgi:hypothetical protein